ncbi:MAG: hypothetical protein C5B43_00965 [Verrucomicrobia bacterium]|nr:MAG: hypothetical protein C5B43_00965 [Verrucomicrobiota bacterium]
MLTSIENQLTNERSKRIVRKLKNDYRLANSVLELLDDEINQEVMERLQIISEELKELERVQEQIIQQIEVTRG